MTASSPHYYIAHLTSLLESIALIIDQHQSVVDKYYGQGRMKNVVRRLQGEGDRVVRSLVEGWEEERRVGRLVSSGRMTCSRSSVSGLRESVIARSLKRNNRNSDTSRLQFLNNTRHPHSPRSHHKHNRTLQLFLVLLHLYFPLMLVRRNA